MCVPFGRFFNRRSEPSDSAHQSSQENHEDEETSPYRHVPVSASASFLRTTTKRDMFEVTEGTRTRNPVSSGAIPEASHSDEKLGISSMDSGNNQSIQPEK